MPKQQVAIIGGGASGFFCASNLDSSRYQIRIFEQGSEVLQKVKISGGGRCNVTNACFDPKELILFYPRGNKELLSVFSKFQPADTMDWFQQRNVPLNIETDNRTFPESNSSQSIIDCFLSEAKKNKVEILTQTGVKSISTTTNGYEIHTSNGIFGADIVIYTTGSSPKSLKIIENLGHNIVPPIPSLFTFNIKDELLSGLMGTSFGTTEISIPHLKAVESGALLITHWGLSGPAVLKLSSWEARSLAQMKYQFEIEVNFLGMDYDEALHTFIEFKKQYPKRSLAQSKMFNISNRFWHKILEISKIDFNKQIAHITNKETQLILENLCKKQLKVTGKSTFKEEFVTCGGVDLREINFKTMASKLLSKFYIAGEVLNIDAITGGFNFQACWSESYLICKTLNEN